VMEEVKDGVKDKKVATRKDRRKLPLSSSAVFHYVLHQALHCAKLNICAFT